jgi:hypothetical protein
MASFVASGIFGATLASGQLNAGFGRKRRQQNIGGDGAPPSSGAAACRDKIGEDLTETLQWHRSIRVIRVSRRW